jgi:hypothetical protein
MAVALGQQRQLEKGNGGGINCPGGTMPSWWK